MPPPCASSSASPPSSPRPRLPLPSPDSFSSSLGRFTPSPPWPRPRRPCTIADGSATAALARFMVKKSLPDPAKHSRPSGDIELVTTKIQDIKDALKEEEYSTATRGQRRRPAAWALGEGVYRILKHEAGGGRRGHPHTHLVYKLELPARGDGEPQEAMNVEPEASFLLQVKNPDPPSGSSGGRGGGGDGGSGFRGLRSKRRAAFPAHLQGAFGSRRYAPADPPDLLNYEGCELLLIAALDDVEEELGLELEGEAAEGEGVRTGARQQWMGMDWGRKGRERG